MNYRTCIKCGYRYDADRASHPNCLNAPEPKTPLFTEEHYEAIARAIAEAHLLRIQCGESRDVFNVKPYDYLVSLFSADNHNFSERCFNKACKVGGDE